MSTRREAREWAVQMLFQLDLNPDPEHTPEEIFQEFWEGQLRLQQSDSATETSSPTQPPEPIRDFTESLVYGVMHNRRAIDALLATALKNWDIQRLGGVERNVLRLGVYELAFATPKTPPAVVINECVDICKYFGTREAGRFVNGILDAIAKKRAQEAAEPQEWSPQA